MASATTRTGAANLGQIQDSSANYASAAGSGYYTAGLTPNIAAYPDGLTLNVFFPETNTGTAQVNINGVGTADMVDADGAAITTPGAIKVGMGMLTFRSGEAYYTPPYTAGKGVFNLIDAGPLASGTAEVGRSYLINNTSSSSTVESDLSAATGDAIAFTKYGTNTFTFNLGTQLYEGSSGPLVTTKEGISVLRYTGLTRGWVET